MPTQSTRGSRIEPPVTQSTSPYTPYVARVDDVSGAQRAILGAETAEQVRDWLARHVRDHLGTGVASVLFTGGDIGAVFGLRLTDDRDVVLKALRSGADVRRLQTVVRAQNALAVSGFGCARVLNGPSLTGGVLAVVEDRLTCVPTGSPHDPAARAAMAAALAAQIDTLRAMDVTDLVAGRPAWAGWERRRVADAARPDLRLLQAASGLRMSGRGRRRGRVR